MPHRSRKYALMLLVLMPAVEQPVVGITSDTETFADIHRRFWQSMLGNAGLPDGGIDDPGAPVVNDAGTTVQVVSDDAGVDAEEDAGVPDGGGPDDAGAEDAGADAGAEDAAAADAGVEEDAAVPLPPPPPISQVLRGRVDGFGTGHGMIGEQSTGTGIGSGSTGDGIGPNSGLQGWGTGINIGEREGTQGFGTGIGIGKERSGTEGFGTSIGIGEQSGTKGFGTGQGIGERTGNQGFGTGIGSGRGYTELGADDGFWDRKDGGT